MLVLLIKIGYCKASEPGALWGLTFAPGILETCCRGMSGQAVNTSNSRSGGLEFNHCQWHCFLRQGTFLHFVSLLPPHV